MKTKDPFVHGEIISEHSKKEEEKERLRKKEISLQEIQTKILGRQTKFNKWLMIMTIIIAITGVMVVSLELIKFFN